MWRSVQKPEIKTGASLSVNKQTKWLIHNEMGSFFDISSE